MKKLLALLTLVTIVAVTGIAFAGTLITDITDFELTAGVFRGWDEGADKPEGVELFKSSSTFALVGWNPKNLRWESLDGQKVHRYAALGIFAGYTGWQGDLDTGGDVDELHVESKKGIIGAQYHFRRVRTGLHELFGLRLGLATEAVDGYGSDEWGAFSFKNDRRWGVAFEAKYTASALARTWLPKLHAGLSVESYSDGGGTTAKLEPKAEIRTWALDHKGNYLFGVEVAGTAQYHWNSDEETQDGKRFYALGPEIFLDFENAGLVFFARAEARWGKIMSGKTAYVLGLTWRR
ncbi:hypothetical protein ACFL0Z_02050 [Patescibacteria group bacterium]